LAETVYKYTTEFILNLRSNRHKRVPNMRAKTERTSLPSSDLSSLPPALASKIISKDGSASLTARQAQILDFVREWIDEQGMPPTRAEICERLGFRSPNAAEEHLRALERKGAIEIVSGASRGIRILKDKFGAKLERVSQFGSSLSKRVGEAIEDLGLPLIGTVAAGSPILAEENIVSRPPVNAALFAPKADYLLKVRGMSMRDVGILDGDWLAVHRTTEAQTGQIVVARIGNEVTVKRLKLKGHQAFLISENPEYQPIVVDMRQSQLAIEGLAVGVIRNLAH
jgi:repressor LexA